MAYSVNIGNVLEDIGSAALDVGGAAIDVAGKVPPFVPGLGIVGTGIKGVKGALALAKGLKGAKRVRSAATSARGLTGGERVGIVREAFQRKGNYGLGQATRSEADELGRDFVGPGFTRSRRDPNILISQDGLRQYRPPSYKPNLGRTQANFEPGGPFNGNGHLDVVP